MKVKITNYKILMTLLVIMPIIDTMSGYLEHQFIGQAYRIIFFFFLILCLTKTSSQLVSLFFGWALVLLATQCFVGLEYTAGNIQQSIKLLTPMAMIVLCSEKEDFAQLCSINTVIDIWSVLYPLTILIPYLLGMDVSSYDGSLGVKGFYYATNEISFVLCTIAILKFVDFANKNKLGELIKFGLNALCIVLLGSKSGYMTLGILLMAYFIKVFGEKKQFTNVMVNRLLYLGVAMFMIAVGWRSFQEVIGGLIERWKWLSVNSSNSTMDFLTSNRIRRLSKGFRIWTNTRWWYPFFGWGFAAEKVGYVNCEMDIVDLLLRTGLFGFFSVIGFYGLVLKSKVKLDFWNNVILLLAAIMIFFAGHILFYGASGMALGVLVIYCVLKSRKDTNYE